MRACVCVCVSPCSANTRPCLWLPWGREVPLKQDQVVKGLECQAKEFGPIYPRAVGSHRRALSKGGQGQI